VQSDDFRLQVDPGSRRKCRFCRARSG